ncbi:MAG: hypothetical protein IIW10_04805 [Spirochaetaceae bacterium]|nr:hypothetical protein [Spirochaetaceae bacterium]
MANLKVCIIAAIVGFVISFFAGIFNSVQFHIIFIRAIFSAILFFGLAFGADFLLKNKLDVAFSKDTSEETSSDDITSSKSSESSTESAVDEDDLPDSDVLETEFTNVPPPPLGEQKEITADKITTNDKMDFRQQDPELLAKAIRTVLKE